MECKYESKGQSFAVYEFQCVQFHDTHREQDLTHSCVWILKIPHARHYPMVKRGWGHFHGRKKKNTKKQNMGFGGQKWSHGDKERGWVCKHNELLNSIKAEKHSIFLFKEYGKHFLPRSLKHCCGIFLLKLLKAQIFQQEDPFEVKLWAVSKHMGNNQNHVKDS